MNKRVILKAAAVFAVVASFAATIASSPAPGSFLAGVKTSERIAALTFDDGPGASTREILGILERSGARATFFVSGSQIASRHGILRDIAAAGHEIGNHTYGHINFYAYKKDDKRDKLKSEIEKTGRLIEEIAGVRPRFLRMPHGYNAAWARNAAGEAGYVMVNWSAGYDWFGFDSGETSAKYVAALAPGAILLFHDGGSRRREKTIAALEALIEAAGKQGYRLVSVGELFESTDR